MKRGRKIQSLCPKNVPTGVQVSSLKLKDVDDLLAIHFGKDWRDRDELQYYKNVVSPAEPQTDNHQDDAGSDFNDEPKLDNDLYQL